MTAVLASPDGRARPAHPGGPDDPGGPSGPSRDRGSRWRSLLRSRDRLVTLRLPGLGWSTRVHLGSVLVTLVLCGLAFLVLCLSVSMGEYEVPLGDVVASLLGRGSGDHDFVINTLRLPRGLTALLVGAAMGLSGAILQRLAANPLASPDIVGINAGAAAAAVTAIALWRWSGPQLSWAAAAGALVAAAGVYLLAYRKGVSGYRLVLVGVGISAILQAVTRYLVSQVETYDAQRAVVWLTGSLDNRDWGHVRPLTIALVVLVPASAAAARQLRLLELGDDAARALGARTEWARARLLLLAVGLAAAGTAAAGPITFVALAAPQMARRLVGGRALALLPGAAAGAVLLGGADLFARVALPSTQLPVGVMTGILGAPYLLYLLARAGNLGRAG